MAKTRVYELARDLNLTNQILLSKLNELDIAHDLYSQGDRLGVVETELGGDIDHVRLARVLVNGPEHTARR